MLDYQRVTPPPKKKLLDYQAVKPFLWANSHSEDARHAIVGVVLSSANVDMVPNFQWTVCEGKYHLNERTFPVIYYCDEAVSYY
ncbi:MAG: hypothetical protein LBR36_00205 [Bacteroidales bacterium]|nr:hypothetical protein [Bacteroidales bacterium]